MKKIFTLLFAFFFLSQVSAQTPSWAWAGNASGTAEVESRAATADTMGNLYVAGRYDLGYAVFGNDTFYNSGLSDLFLAKYDPSGNVLWALRAGQNKGDRANALITDLAGNVYMAGYFESPYIVFGTDTLFNPSSPNADLFLTKFNGNGQLIWARSEGDPVFWDEADAIAMDALGFVYVTGTFTGINPVYGTDVLTNQSPGSADIYLAKYDALGNMLWAKSAGSNGIDFPESMTISPFGDLYIAGNFAGPVFTAGTSTAGNVSPGEAEIFLTKYNLNGNVTWTKSMPGDSVDQGSHVTTDALGNIYLASFYSGDSLNFGGSVSVHNTSATWSVYHDDIAFTKFDPNGNAMWVKTASGADNEETKSIAADPSGNIYVAGYFKDAPMIIGTTTLTAVGGYDIFLIKYDTAGTMQWAISAGGAGSEQWPHIATHGNMLWSTGGKMQASNGSMYMSGYFDSNSINFGSDVATSTGTNNMFVARLGVSATTAAEIVENKQALSLYPNPSTGRFILSTGGLSNIAVYSAIGNKILERSAGKNETTLIDLSGHADGVYFVKIDTGDKSVTRKLVLNRE